MTRRGIYNILMFFSSLLVMGSLALSSGLNRPGALELKDMIYGTAPKPFVYRQLLPSIVRLTAQSIPLHLRSAVIEKASQSSTITRILSRVQIPHEWIVEYAVTVLWIYCSLWGFLFSFRFLFKAIYDTPRYFADGVFFSVLMGIPAFFSYSFIYDIPTLFLFTLALGMMYSRKWGLYVTVFFIACWSKETTILLTLIFFIHFQKKEKLDRSVFKKLLGAQLFLFLFVKITLEIIFKDNSGGIVEFHFIHNLLFGYAYTLPQFLSWVFFVLLIIYKWNEKPLFLKNALWMGLPLVILTMFLGLLHELRDYGEMYPILMTLTAHSAALILGIPCSVKENV